MTAIATSDLHGNFDNLDFSNADIVFIAGDFSDLRGMGKWHWHDQKKWIQKKFTSFVSRYPNVQFCVVPGNHDMVFDKSKTSIYPDLDFRIELPDNVHLLIDQTIELNGLKIHGTPWVPIISYRWAFEAEHDKLAEKFKSIPQGIDVLITHSPPHVGNDCVIDRSMQFGGPEAFGSTELAEEILKKKPKYVFCGHIHSGTHDCVEFGDSKIFNVSRVDENYEIAYPPKEIEF